MSDTSRYARGGVIKGYDGTSDSVPVVLTGHDFPLITAERAQRRVQRGRRLLEAINEGREPDNDGAA